MSYRKSIAPVTFGQIKKNLLSALFILIGISILVAASFLAAFLWSVKNGQFDDDYTPSVRILFDDTSEIPSTTTTKQQKTNLKN
ncbi:MAG: cbb3-type cytochrome oxidase assembly protein CcoS [Ferruginibacter sp.]